MKRRAEGPAPAQWRLFLTLQYQQCNLHLFHLSPVLNIGAANATASALGLTESETIPVTITVSEDGRISIESGSDIFPDVVTLNGNTFNYSQNFVDSPFGAATCSGMLTLQGAIDTNGKLKATLSSQSVTCNGIPGTVSGSLTATKQ